MTGYSITRFARRQLADIYIYSRRRWDIDQAEAYVRGLHRAFGDIASRRSTWRPIAATFEIDGFVVKYRHHLIYWRVRSDDLVEVVAVLHERMNQSERLLDAWPSADGTQP